MESSQTNGDDPFLNFVASFIGSHPVYYFMNKGMESAGFNLTETVSGTLNNTFVSSISQKMMLSNDPGRFVMHPMYVML